MGIFRLIKVMKIINHNFYFSLFIDDGFVRHCYFTRTTSCLYNSSGFIRKHPSILISGMYKRMLFITSELIYRSCKDDYYYA
ncbi:hypothetical protein F4826_001743 [Rahnella inusitata]|nr:hypothetical protein [Rahnella inusitata]